MDPSLVDAATPQADGGTSTASLFWDWLETQAKPFL